MQCRATKRDGTPCTLPARGDNEFCWAHDPANAEQRKKATSKAGSTKPSSELREAKRRLKEYIEGVVEGGLDKGRASVAFQGYGVLCRFIEQERKQRELEELEERLAALEEAAEERRRAYGV